MKEQGHKNDYLIRWGMKKLAEGWMYESVVEHMKEMRKKSLQEIKELVKN